MIGVKHDTNPFEVRILLITVTYFSLNDFDLGLDSAKFYLKLNRWYYLIVAVSDKAGSGCILKRYYTYVCNFWLEQ